MKIPLQTLMILIVTLGILPFLACLAQGILLFPPNNTIK